MRVRFTKMQGAGNDFVVLDGTRARLELDAAQVKRLGDRRFGVGADQILVVDRATTPGVDFGYRIFNGGSGDEVEHCGNGARCFVRYVRDKGLAEKSMLVVETMNRRLELRLQDDGRVTVDMGPPDFDPAHVPFDITWMAPRAGDAGLPLWPLELGAGKTVDVGVVSMGNPHAVQVVADVDAAPVATQGPAIEKHVRFVQGVNAGFMQIVSRARDSPARVGARRGRDAGLRHGRVRGGRGRHPSRPARRHRRRRDARRRPHDRMARRHGAGPHDRPGRDRVRRRDRPVSPHFNDERRNP